MPLPPLCGPVLYGSTIGLRSTSDNKSCVSPSYVSLPPSSCASVYLSRLASTSAREQRTPLERSPAADPTSASAAVTVASTPSPLASPLYPEESREDASKFFQQLLPLSCCTDHPYRERAASEFCILNAWSPSGSVPVREYEEVLLIGGPSVRDFLLPLHQHNPSVEAECGCNASRKTGARSAPAEKGRAATACSPAAADTGPQHLLWVVCCPTKTELHEQQQRQQRAQCPPHLLRGGRAYQPADDEEPVRAKGLVCADLKQLQRAADDSCRWRVVRHPNRIETLMLQRAPASTASVGAREQSTQKRVSKVDAAAGNVSEPPVGGVPLRWDEEIYFQNVQNGCFLSLRRHAQPRESLDIIAVASASRALTPSPACRNASLFSENGATGSSSLAAETTGHHAHLLAHVSPAAVSATSYACTAPLGSQNTIAAVEQKYSGWRLVLAGVAVPPWWNRQYACTLMAPTEIDDCLLRRETLNGVSIAAYLQGPDRQLPSCPLRGTAAIREVAGEGTAVAWLLQQQQVLALSPYTQCCKFHTAEEGAGGSVNGAHIHFAADKCRSVSGGSSHERPRMHCGGSASLAESWRHASTVGQQQVGENEWVMRRLQRDWKALSREVKERFLLEDLLFCLSGIDGTLVRVFAVQDTCCCVVSAARSHDFSAPSTNRWARRDSHARDKGNSITCVQMQGCCCHSPPVSSSDTEQPIHCYNKVKKTLPQFRSWLHPLLTGASCYGSEEHTAGGGPSASQQAQRASSASFHSIFWERDGSSQVAGGERLSNAPSVPGQQYFSSAEDSTFCQILPSLMPAACSLRLLLVFLELASRSQTTVRTFRNSQRRCCTRNDGVCATKSEKSEPETTKLAASVHQRGSVQAASSAFKECADFTTADITALKASGGTRCSTWCCEDDAAATATQNEREDEEGGGQVLDSLCFAIRKFVEEIGIRVGIWEGEVRRGCLTLQGLRAQLGPVARAAAVAEQVARLAFGKRGGDILNAIEAVQSSIPCSDSGQQICRFLFEKAAAPLAKMVESWIYHGKILDPYDEFFIRYTKPR